jgi:hypothetical protein
MRRSRWTVKFRDGRKLVILAYSGQGVRDHYERRGQEVVSVTKGDYRARVAASAPSGGGWELSHRALKQASDQLGLTLPITVKKNGKVGGTNATYRLKPHGHHIIVKAYLTKQQATESLWHELQHAQQAERAGGTPELWAAESKRQRAWPYRRRPIEIEARRTATANSHKSLTK